MDTSIAWHQIGTNDQWLGIEHYPSKQPTRCAACLVHGFRAWHRWGFFPRAGVYFAEHGIDAYAIALPSSGYGPSGFSAERFALGTITADRQALTIALDYIRSQAAYLLGVGHSRGGLLLLLEHAALDCLALWMPPRRFGRWSKRQCNQWRQNGFLPAGTHPDTGEPIVLSITYLIDIEQHEYNAQLERAAHHCRTPTIVLAAELDLVASPAEAAELVAMLGTQQRAFDVLPKTGHTLDTTHPAACPSAALMTALERTLAFYRSHYTQCGNFATR